MYKEPAFNTSPLVKSIIPFSAVRFKVAFSLLSILPVNVMPPAPASISNFASELPSPMVTVPLLPIFISYIY